MDFVFCNNCETLALVPAGDDACPTCGFVGALMWADESIAGEDVTVLDVFDD